MLAKDARIIRYMADGDEKNEKKKKTRKEDNKGAVAHVSFVHKYRIECAGSGKGALRSEAVTSKRQKPDAQEPNGPTNDLRALRTNREWPSSGHVPSPATPCSLRLKRRDRERKE